MPTRTRARSSIVRASAGALLAATLPGVARAFSFTFGSTPTQCQNATINIIGDDGVPPYNIVILAYGNPPGGDEVRKIIDYSFTDKKSSVNIAFPSNSAFVAVVSDSTGFGKGGTTLSVNTASSDDSSCLPTKGSLSPGFYLVIDNLTDIHTCQSRRIGYSKNPASEGKVTIYGIIPGGDSFAIDMSAAKDEGDDSMGIDWTPNVPPFTDIIFMGGDDRGRGSGGSTDRVNIKEGPNRDCLTGDYPLSTAGTPAGQVFPTESSISNNNGSGTNIGAIVGGVIGALVFVILVLAGLLFYFWRRRRQNRNNHIKEKPDLTDDPRPLAASVENNHELTAEPFIVPPSITSGSRPGTPSEATTAPGGAVPPSAWARGHRPSHSGASQRTGGGHGYGGGNGRPQSMATTDEGGGAPSTFGGLSAWERKHGASGGPQLRPVNIIQHDDGGEVGEGMGEADTVELPPAYGNIRPRASPTPAASEGATPPAADATSSPPPLQQPPPAQH